jgi:hypothetical protein
MDYDFDTESSNMITHYLRRGYPKSLLIKHRDSAKGFSQEELLIPKIKEVTDREIIVTRYITPITLT